MNYIKIFFVLLSFFGLVLVVNATELDSANFLAQKGYINNQSNNPSEYRLNDKITRKEFMKVVGNFSGQEISDNCKTIFLDMPNDWSCKYITFGFEKGFLSKNKYFRPDDYISKSEALKLIFKSRNIQTKYNSESWQDNYVNSAVDLGLFASKSFDYNLDASRGWIFSVSSKSFSDFSTKTYNNSGSNETKKNLVNGKLEGEYIEYYTNGNIKLKTSYKQGLLHGDYNGFYEDSSKNFEAFYEYGKIEGVFTKYYKNGVISQKEEYYKGALSGFSYFYDTSGKLIKEKEYIGGFFLSEKKY